MIKIRVISSKLHCRAAGGKEAEKEERDRWISRERKRIQDSVDGNIFNVVAKFHGLLLYYWSYILVFS